jgi:hypothetical protein
MERCKSMTVISLLAIGMLGTAAFAKSVNPTFRTFANPNMGIGGLVPDGWSEVRCVTSLSRSALHG